jgi:thiol-disulfide isomerase/thioredoxin
MKRLLALVTGSLLAVAACSGGKDAVDQGAGGQFRYHNVTAHGKTITPADRKAVGKVSGELLGGGTFTLAEQTGKVVVLNFWGSWCGPCKTELPQFDLLYRKVKDKGVDFVGINTKDPKDNARAFIRNNDISFPNVYDEPGEVAVRLGNLPAVSLPFTVLVDQAGKVAAVYIARLSFNDLQGSIDKLLAER